MERKQELTVRLTFDFLKIGQPENSNHQVSVCVHISMKAACFGDEKLSFIRSFHSSTLFFKKSTPQGRTLLYLAKQRLGER